MHHDHKMSSEMQACIEDCLRCHSVCLGMASHHCLEAGGKQFHYIECLNDQQEWINALCAVALQHLSGWDTETTPDPSLLESSRTRALALGATR